jgi:outer membrane protein OmpA-like peptidoglycan-associated protein
MRLRHTLLLSLLMLLVSCTTTSTSRYATAPTGLGNNAKYSPRSANPPPGYSYSYDRQQRQSRRAARSGGGSLPFNPDPNKCYVRCVIPDEYETVIDSVFTYAEEEALLYPHKEKRFVTQEEFKRWESTRLEDCESENPNDCQVLCLKTYPAESFAYFEPTDASKGAPFWELVERAEMVGKGGLSSYEEIDCELTAYNVLPVAFKKGSAKLSFTDKMVLDDGLLALLKERRNIRVQINAHTSSEGSAAVNQSLTEYRTNSIADYLVSRGIKRHRLVARGYGESQLKNRCADGVNCSEEEHALNRRVEFRVLNNEL